MSVVDKNGQPLAVGDVIVGLVWEKGVQVLKPGIVTRIQAGCTGCQIEMSAVVDVPTPMPCAVPPTSALLIAKGDVAVALAAL